MSVTCEDISNEFICFVAKVELKCSKFLIHTLLTQQLKVKNILEKPIKSKQDLQSIYTYIQEIEKILFDKRQVIIELYEEFKISNKNITKNKLKLHSKTNEKKYTEKKNESNINSIHSCTEIKNNTISDTLTVKTKNTIPPALPTKANKEQSLSISENPLKKCFKCTVDGCGKTYAFQNSRYDHIQKIHRNITHHTCEYCNLGFYYKCDWRKHIRITHGKNCFGCSVCNESFMHNSLLSTHLQSVHSLETVSDEKRFECNVCPKSFAHKRSLRAHANIHKNDKPFVCEMCHKTFSNKYGLKTHLMLHSGEKPFECLICKKRFTQKCNLKCHLKRNHNINEIGEGFDNDMEYENIRNERIEDKMKLEAIIDDKNEVERVWNGRWNRHSNRAHLKRNGKVKCYVNISETESESNCVDYV